MKSQEQKWIEFRIEILEKINAIDLNVEWEEVEPGWWLKMMEVQKLVQKQVSENK